MNGAIPKPEDFIGTIKQLSNEQKKPAFRLGTIPAGYVSGMPTVQFDGESAASARTYPYLASYTPAAGDRVLVALVGHGAVIIGKVV